MSQPSKKPHKDFHVWVQTVSGLLSIAIIAGGTLLSLFQSQQVRITAAVICAGIIGYGAFKRQWVAVAAPLLAMVALVAFTPAPAGPTAAQPQPQANQPSTASTAAPITPAASQSNKSSQPGPIATFDVTLTPHDAVNIDNPSGPVVTSNQSGATGGNDMYLYDHAVASPRIYITNSGTMVYPQGTSGDEYNTCAAKLKPNSGASTHGWSGVSIEAKMCFYTSEGNLAYAAVTGVDQPNGSEPPRSVTLHVIVWKKP